MSFSKICIMSSFLLRYEIGYMRNDAAAGFEDGCFCSYSNVTKDSSGEKEGDSLYSYVCNLDEPEGLQSIFESKFLI